MGRRAETPTTGMAVNVIIYAPDRPGLGRAQRLLGSFARPRRTVVLLGADARQASPAVPPGPPLADHPSHRALHGAADAWLTLDGVGEARVASAAASLVEPELPVIICALGHPPASGESWLRLGDCLVVDSRSFADGDFARLASLIRPSRDRATICDLGWLRIFPWRALLAQFFDPPAARAYLPLVRTVRIEFVRGSLAPTFLLLGWLASRLSWTPVGATIAEGSPGASLRFRCGQGTVDVACHPVPRQDDTMAGDLIRLTLAAADDRGEAAFDVSLDHRGEHLDGQARMPGVPTARYYASALHAPDALLVSRELDLGDRDRVYEASLAVVAEISRRSSPSGLLLSGLRQGGQRKPDEIKANGELADGGQPRG